MDEQYTDSNTFDNAVEKTLEQLREEKRIELLEKVKDLSFDLRYHADLSGLSYEALTAIQEAVERFKTPRQKAHDQLNDWLESNKEETKIFTEEVVELVESLADTLGVDVVVEEKIDVRVDLTVRYNRKPWQKDENVCDELIDNLTIRVDESYSDYLVDYDVDSVEVNA